MNKLVFMGAAVAALATGAHAYKLINFDDGQTNSTAIGSFYSGLGVTFTNASWTNNFGVLGASGAQGLIDFPQTYKPQQSSPIGASFTSTVSSVTLRGVDVGQSGFRLKAFDASNALIDNQVAIGNSGGLNQFFDLTVTGAISRIEMSQDNSSSDQIIFDNMSFDAAPVPEPATMATLGLGALALIRRKRAKK